ncbi:conjugal transfer protein [Virgibacillus pantothenticus]|uniref:conjugal transfer protein n=1 Tax=Virgibacillus pantothenticus TaxID=1473 RepID=UPI0020B2C038|nr:conjugal transfer protein [Virgibacillus pantothenticus]MEB5454193.1 conjugal transfer protein [Virgibacillus pantothenticus]MEB5458437.1 conjugal transfer protein [Virgibacillus pantothenticus]MEB5462614.1 conjugal transfer protein [Virgibacillus pantothenticus]MEB5466790.1 conjugal transfer protein [Virgibacillus pantothenticus]MEB5471028.1 conjugal transfer protein [Virgibacillus pantothenticus]
MKNIFRKKEKETVETKSSKTKVKSVGTRKKSVTVLWIVLISSLVFGIYKNFTAIDQHTVHEKEVIETKLVDTSAIESFTKSFVKDYYTWQNNKESIEQREEKLSHYLTEELQALNTDTVRADIPTSSSVSDIDIWSVSQEDDFYAVVYTVEQKITEDKNSENISSTYQILLYQDNVGNLVITQSPTLWNTPKKSDYEPQQPESDGTVDSDTAQEVTEFLETFFTFYPTATDKELAYYVKNNALPQIDRDYLFTELVNPIFQKEDQQIKVWVTIRYIDGVTKVTQNSQLILTLEKDMNWMIIKRH